MKPTSTTSRQYRFVRSVAAHVAAFIFGSLSGAGELLSLQSIETSSKALVGVVVGSGHICSLPVVSDAQLTAPSGVPCSLSLSAVDADGDVLLFRMETQPQYGAVEGLDSATGTGIYTSLAGYTGGDSFTFSVSEDGSAWSSPGTCSISVTEVTLGTFDITNGNVSTVEWGAQYGATRAADQNIDHLSLPAADGTEVFFVSPEGSRKLKRDVRGALIGERWQLGVSARATEIGVAWSADQLPPGQWYLWQLTGLSGIPVPGTVLDMRGSTNMLTVDTFQTLYFAIGVPDPIGIDSVFPSGGSESGGGTVTIAGSGFMEGIEVHFGEIAAASVTVLSSSSLTAVSPAHNRGSVAVSVVNADGGRADFSDVFTFNTGPTADAGGPYTFSGGMQPDLDLDGSGSWTPYSGEILSYEWDLDNDGMYDDAAGVSPTLPWSVLENFLEDDMWIYDDPASIGLRVTDSLGWSSNDFTTVTIRETRAWALELTVEGGSEEVLRIGLHPDASDSADEQDREAGTLPGDGAVSVFHSSAERSLADDIHFFDLVDPPEYSGWVLELGSNDAEPCVLSWDPDAVRNLGPRGLYLIEIDGGADGQIPSVDARVSQTGLRIDMSETSQLTVSTGKKSFFRLVYGFVEYELRITNRWNLVSLPIEPFDPGIDTLFAGELGIPTTDGMGVIPGVVWVFNSSRQSYEARGEIHALVGFWLYTAGLPGDSSEIVAVKGVPVSDRDYPLPNGPAWHLLGVSEERTFVTDTDIPGPVYWWDSVQSSYSTTQTGQTLEPGVGYWFVSNASTTLNPSGR